ncbi:MAG: hypothetical protein IKE30_06220 [Clostridia bacterium]|nr:hypothetical protein [Clostridia bacterium]
MQKALKLRAAIAVMMLAAAACVLLGKSVIYGPGFTLSYPYIGALFPAADSGFRATTTIYVWILLAGGVAAAVVVWLKPAWAALAAFAICLSSLVYHVIRSVQGGFSVFQIDGVWEFFMLALPLVSAVLCIVLYRTIKQER